MACEAAATCQPPAFRSRYYLQDTRAWHAVHGGGKAHCNILLADGSVQTFADQNGDGYLNPGFPALDDTGAALTDEEAISVGYSDAAVELHPARITSVMFLNNSLLAKPANFE